MAVLDLVARHSSDPLDAAGAAQKETGRTMSLERQWTSEKTITLRGNLISVIGMIMVVWFVGGLLLFPDAPIHLCDPSTQYFYHDHPFGYCGKQGQSHTTVDFHRFQVWETALLCLWPSGMLAIAALGHGLSKKRP
jgi:hypothetical protein